MAKGDCYQPVVCKIGCKSKQTGKVIKDAQIPGDINLKAIRL